MLLVWLTGVWTEREKEGPNDEALVAAARRGSADAFERLHRRYYRRIYRLAYLKTGNASDAEDIASETFLRALSHLPKLQFVSGSGSLYPWLHRIASNLIVDSGRQKPPAPVLSLDAPLVQGLRDLLAKDHLADAAPSPHEIAERHEVQTLVRAAIHRLPEDQADVLVYRFLGDLSLREIAPLLQRSESAAKSLLHRAVVALRAELRLSLDAAERTGDVRPTSAGKEATLDGRDVPLAARRGGP